MFPPYVSLSSVTLKEPIELFLLKLDPPLEQREIPKLILEQHGQVALPYGALFSTNDQFNFEVFFHEYSTLAVSRTDDIEHTLAHELDCFPTGAPLYVIDETLPDIIAALERNNIDFQVVQPKNLPPQEVSLTYMTSKDAEKLLFELIAKYDTGSIYNAKGFVQHHLDTGNLAWEMATHLLENHPELSGEVNPDKLRVYGYLHDIGKIWVGVPFHEIVSAYYILNCGEEWGLVKGGTRVMRRQILKEMAKLSLSDSLLYTMLGPEKYGLNNYQKAYYKNLFDWESIKRSFTQEGINLPIEDLLLPKTIEEQIALCADSMNLNGHVVSIEERDADALARYTKSDPTYARLMVLANQKPLKFDDRVMETIAHIQNIS